MLAEGRESRYACSNCKGRLWRALGAGPGPTIGSSTASAALPPPLAGFSMLSPAGTVVACDIEGDGDGD